MVSPAQAPPPLPALPTAPASPPVFAMSPVGSKPTKKTPTASFLNAAALPDPGTKGGKQLIGQ